MNKLTRYFLQGFLFTVPILLILFFLKWIDGIIPNLFSIPRENYIPGLGTLILLALFTVIGALTSSLLTKPAFTTIDNLLYKIPFINLIHSSTKDVLDAFVGEKKKFDKPVLVKVSKEFNTYRIGFVTRHDLRKLNIASDNIAVYFPHSYNISGNLLLIPKEEIVPIEAPSAEIMKFIVSGGVSGLNH